MLIYEYDLRPTIEEVSNIFSKNWSSIISILIYCDHYKLKSSTMNLSLFLINLISDWMLFTSIRCCFLRSIWCYYSYESYLDIYSSIACYLGLVFWFIYDSVTPTITSFDFGFMQAYLFIFFNSFWSFDCSTIFLFSNSSCFTLHISCLFYSRRESLSWLKV